jgi:hypothetical protein
MKVNGICLAGKIVGPQFINFAMQKRFANQAVPQQKIDLWIKLFPLFRPGIAKRLSMQVDRWVLRHRR